MKTEDLFPHDGFPIRLEYTDGKDHKICWFQCDSHFEKHMTRYKLNPNECKVNYYGVEDEADSSIKPNRRNRKANPEKPVRKVSKPKSATSKGRTPKTTTTTTKRKLKNDVATVGKKPGRKGKQKGS
jgi:hypothetical protein